MDPNVIEIVPANEYYVPIIEKFVKDHTKRRNIEPEFTSESYIRSNLGKYFEFFIAIKLDQAGLWRDIPPRYEDCLGCVMFVRSFRFEHGRHLIMHNLYVKNEHRKKGLGLKLVKQVMKVAKEENASIELVTDSSNTKVIEWYQKLGAKIMFSFIVRSTEKVTLVFDKESINNLLL